MKRCCCPGEGEHDHEIEQDKCRETDEYAGDERALVMANHMQRRKADLFGALHRCFENRSLRDGEPYIQPKQDERRAGEEGKPPAEGEKLLIGHPFRQQQEGAAGKQKARRRAELRKHAVQRPLARRGILNRQQHRAAPLAAQPNALAEAAESEQQWCHYADGLVRRQGTDGERGEPHGRERQHQGFLRPMRSPK